MPRSCLKYSVGYKSVKCEEPTRVGKNPPEELEGIVHITHTGPGVAFAPKSKSEPPHNSPGDRSRTKKGLASAVGKITPNSVLISTNA